MVDAAVLLEAGWTDMVHEVWVTVIPEDEVRIDFSPTVLNDSKRRKTHKDYNNRNALPHI